MKIELKNIKKNEKQNGDTWKLINAISLVRAVLYIWRNVRRLMQLTEISNY